MRCHWSLWWRRRGRRRSRSDISNLWKQQISMKIYINFNSIFFILWWICAAGAEGVPDLIWKRDTGFNVCLQPSICTDLNLKFILKLNALAEILTGSLANWMFPRENPPSQFCPSFILFCDILRPPPIRHKDCLTIPTLSLNSYWRTFLSSVCETSVELCWNWGYQCQYWVRAENFTAAAVAATCFGFQA